MLYEGQSAWNCVYTRIKPRRVCFRDGTVEVSLNKSNTVLKALFITKKKVCEFARFDQMKVDIFLSPNLYQRMNKIDLQTVMQWSRFQFSMKFCPHWILFICLSVIGRLLYRIVFSSFTYFMIVIYIFYVIHGIID